MEQRAILTPVRFDVPSCNYCHAHPNMAGLLKGNKLEVPRRFEEVTFSPYNRKTQPWDTFVTTKPTPELWDQLRELVRTLPWTTQDEAMWQLIPEMKNIYPVFAVRKSDGLLLGGVCIVVTDIVFGPFYVIRPGIRGNGIGMKMMGPLLGLMVEPIKTRAIIGRAVKVMIEKYSGPPFYAIHRHEMYAFGLTKEELLHLFTCTAANKLVSKSFKDMNAEQFDKVCAYDKKVSGRDRRDFLIQYHSLFFTKGVALLNASGEVQGIAGAVPTLHSSRIIKIGPVFTATQENACFLIKCITDMFAPSDVKFVLHVSTETAGDWILKKCRDANVPLSFVGTAANATYSRIIYKDPCDAELMFIPMNCPIYFDR